MIRLSDEILPENTEMRKAFCDTLMELAGEDKNVILMDGDLMEPWEPSLLHRNSRNRP